MEAPEAAHADGGSSVWAQLLKMPRLVAVGVLLLAVLALPGFYVGAVDGVVTPVSLAAQLVGLSFLAAGLGAVAGICGLLAPRTSNWRLRAVTVGGASGFYIALTIALNARGYTVWMFVAGLVCAAPSFALATIGAAATVNSNREAFGSTIKTVGASIAVLVAAAQLWYTSIYQPNTTDVGLDISASVGAPQRLGPALALVPVQLTVRNDSSITAVVLTSMFAVTGVRYSTTKPAAALSNAATEKRALAVGLGTIANPQGIDVNHREAPQRSLLAIGRLMNDGSYLHASAVVTHPIIVAIPSTLSTRFREIDLEIQLDYARSARLVLANFHGRVVPFHGPRAVRYMDCNADVRTDWSLQQSALRKLTRGEQVLVTNWCAQPDRERVFADVTEAAYANWEHPPDRDRDDHDYGIVYASRIDMLPLSNP
jgi:hypothetical protein